MTLIELAVPLAVFALGNIAGTVLGGQLADRVRDRLLTFAVAMALSGVAALVLFTWHPGPAVSVAVGFVYVLLNALGRPSFMASLASVPEDVRGTVLGLNGTSASVGWIGAAALGAVMIGSVGLRGLRSARRLCWHCWARAVPCSAAAAAPHRDFYFWLFYMWITRP